MQNDLTEKLKAPFRASLPQLFSESCHKRDEWHIWTTSWGFHGTGQTQDSAGGKPAAACHILVNYPNDFPPTEKQESRLLLYFMKILLYLLTNINWICSLLIPASGVWGSLQVREGRWQGSGDLQEVPSFSETRLVLWGDRHLISPLQLVSLQIRGKYRKPLCQFWLLLLWTPWDLLDEREINPKHGYFMTLWVWCHRRQLS